MLVLIHYSALNARYRHLPSRPASKINRPAQERAGRPIVDMLMILPGDSGAPPSSHNVLPEAPITEGLINVLGAYLSDRALLLLNTHPSTSRVEMSQSYLYTDSVYVSAHTIDFVFGRRIPTIVKVLSTHGHPTPPSPTPASVLGGRSERNADPTTGSHSWHILCLMESLNDARALLLRLRACSLYTGCCRFLSISRSSHWPSALNEALPARQIPMHPCSHQS